LAAFSGFGGRGFHSLFKTFQRRIQRLFIAEVG
jgi:hypothetical protein